MGGGGFQGALRAMKALKLLRYGRTWLNRGISTTVVAKQLGHRDEKMVWEHYGHLADGHIADAVCENFGELCVTVANNVAEFTPKQSAKV
jgi:hypothetical protein